MRNGANLIHGAHSFKKVKNKSTAFTIVTSMLTAYLTPTQA